MSCIQDICLLYDLSQIKKIGPDNPTSEAEVEDVGGQTKSVIWLVDRTARAHQCECKLCERKWYEYELCECERVSVRNVRVR